MVSGQRTWSGLRERPLYDSGFHCIVAEIGDSRHQHDRLRRTCQRRRYRNYQPVTVPMAARLFFVSHLLSAGSKHMQVGNDPRNQESCSTYGVNQRLIAKEDI
jgi:hypothetical protein